MKQERINFGTILRVGLSLIPLLFGLFTPAMVVCSYNIALSFLLCGPITCLISSLSAICLSMVFCGAFGAAAQLQGFYIGIEAVLCAIACVYAIEKKRGYYTGMWLAAAGFLLPSCINLYSLASGAGQSIAQFLTSEPLALVKSNFETVLNRAAIKEAALNEIFNQVSHMIVMSIPSILVLTSILVGYVVMWIVCASLRTTPLRVEHSFAQIRVPRTVVLLFVITLGIAAVVQNTTATYVAANSAAIFGGICFFGGMSAVDFYLRRAVKNTLVRIIIHFLFYMASALFMGISVYVNIFTVYILLGAVGSFFNIRKHSDVEINL